MKKFVSNTILFLLPILICLICFEVFLRNIPNDYKNKKQYLDNHAQQIETLIMGDSHSLYGVDPKYMNVNAFNISHLSQSLKYDYKILMKYQQELTQLQTLILPISTYTYWYRLEKGHDSWRTKNYVIYYNMSSAQLKDYFEITSVNFRTNLFRIKSFLEDKESVIHSSELGWGTDYKSEEAQDLETSGKANALRHTGVGLESEKYQKVFEQNVFYLNEILKFCKSKNIKVILFTPPAYKTYTNKLNPNQVEKTIHTTKKIANKFDNCVYINLLNDKSFIGSDFYDANHLSEIGAKKLTIKLQEIR